MTKNLRSLLFTNSSAGQTIAKNTIWLTASRLFGHLIKAGFLIYVARALGTAGYGVFSYALSMTILFSVLADIGVGGLVTRNVSVSRETNRPFLATALVIKIFLILIGILSIIFIAPFFTKIPEVVSLLPIVALLMAVDAAREFVLAINRAKEKMEIEAGILTLTNVFVVIAGIFSVILWGTSASLLLAYTIGSALGLIVALIVLGKHLSGIRGAFDRTLVKTIVQESWPFALLGLMGIIMINTDIIMLGFFRDANEIGLYAAAQKPIQVLYSIPALIAVAFLPTITKLKDRDATHSRRLLEQTISTTLLLGIPVVLGGLIVGKPLINLLFGEVYAGAALPFQILLITVLIVFPSMIIANTVFAYNEQKRFIGYLLMGVIGNIIFNLLLIPKYGINGSAIATIGAELSANTLIWRKMKKINHFSVLVHLKKVIAAATIMTVATILMQFLGVQLLVNVVSSALIYIVALKIFNEPLLKTAWKIISINK